MLIITNIHKVYKWKIWQRHCVHIDYTNVLLNKEPKGKIVNILIEDGLDFVDPE